MDLKDLTAGSTLFSLSSTPGRLLHWRPARCQGDGEVSGTALEQSLTGVFRFMRAQGQDDRGAARRDAHALHPMGIDLDLDRAMRLASRKRSISWSRRRTYPDKAFSLASIAVDFHVAEAVDLTQVVAAKIPKSLFLNR